MLYLQLLQQVRELTDEEFKLVVNEVSPELTRLRSQAESGRVSRGMFLHDVSMLIPKVRRILEIDAEIKALYKVLGLIETMPEFQSAQLQGLADREGISQKYWDIYDMVLLLKNKYRA